VDKTKNDEKNILNIFRNFLKNPPNHGKGYTMLCLGLFLTKNERLRYGSDADEFQNQ
jgi:hypothetical protein